MVAIKDMAIPSCCGECDFCTDNWECILLRKRIINIVGANAKHSDCPLVDIEERKVGKCTDCEDYNQEKHYCPKFCDVIRDTTKEMQDFYKGEHEKLERIEQIVEDYDGSAVSMVKQFSEIQKVVENE